MIDTRVERCKGVYIAVELTRLNVDLKRETCLI